MVAYYNEFDPHAAAWLRELIKEGLIAPGDVDERSIEDVAPVDIRGYTQCHFFAGIGGWSYALRLAGWPDDRAVWTGSCPCQPFSAAGKGEGFDDERHLWPAWYWLIRQCRPGVIFGEQVASKAGLAWFDLVSSDLEGAGYAVAAVDLCAASVGAPHIRQRLWFVADTRSIRCKQWRQTSCPAIQGECTERGRQQQKSRDHGQLSRRFEGLCRIDHLPAFQNEGDNKSRIGIVGQWQLDFQQSGAGETINTLADIGCGGLARWQSQQGNDGAKQSSPEQTDDTMGTVADTENTKYKDSTGAQGLDCTTPTNIDRRISEIAQGKSGRGCCSAILLADTDCEQWDTNCRQSNAKTNRGHNITWGSNDDNPWANPEWLPCRDGKTRPTQSGLSPLAYGVPERMVRGSNQGAPINANGSTEARIMRLKGYGNSIVPQLASEFIKAYLEASNGIAAQQR